MQFVLFAGKRKYVCPVRTPLRLVRTTSAISNPIVVYLYTYLWRQFVPRFITPL